MKYLQNCILVTLDILLLHYNKVSRVFELELVLKCKTIPETLTGITAVTSR